MMPGGKIREKVTKLGQKAKGDIVKAKWNYHKEGYPGESPNENTLKCGRRTGGARALSVVTSLRGKTPDEPERLRSRSPTDTL